MSRHKKLILACCMTLLVFDASASIADAIKNGSSNTELRYRLEQVEQDGFNEDALASTLKVRMNFKTDEYRDFTWFTEFDSVINIGNEQYNSGAGTSGPGRAIYPVVADPEGTEINQAYIAYSGFSDASIKVGRQRILLDNQRFVGNVGWRQNEQTYDALSLDRKFAFADLKYAYVGNVNRIFGETVEAGDHTTRTHLLNLKRDFPLGKLSGYAYLIDNKDETEFSTSTLGLRWTASEVLGNSDVSYGLEYASQSDNADNPVDYTAAYFRLDAAYTFEPAKVYLGYEILEGDANTGDASFRTPLATLHAFNGWADQFLATPGAGLEDVFVGATGSFDRWNWDIKFHDFSANDGGGDFGTELDLSVSTKVAKDYSVLLKYADFSSELAGSDVAKLWIMLQARF